MENLTFADEENIPLIIQDEDYDNYSTPDTTPSRVDETSTLRSNINFTLKIKTRAR